MKIECSEQQARIMIEALDLYSRLLMGQLHSVFDLLDKRRPLNDSSIRWAFGPIIDSLTRMIFSHGSNGSKGISHPKTPIQSKEAYDMIKTLQQFIYNNTENQLTHSSWKDGNDVKFGVQPLMKITL